MATKVFLVYPCGKKIEIRTPIIFFNNGQIESTIKPGDKEYFKAAQSKFQINNLVVIEEEVLEKTSNPGTFTSIAKKIKKPF